MRFRTLTDDPRGTLTIERFVDDLEGAAVARAELRSGEAEFRGAGFVLYQNVPNPFNPSTTIHYEVPASAQVALSVYDVGGRLVRRLVNDQKPRGSHVVRWDGRDEGGQEVSSGVYFVLLRSAGFTLTKRMVLLK